ncbi:hypothetical protein N0V94_002207 [Neodidymelliopsis sp. IMI 364377]|nr:hypothetical protein N0V94_002207 [Neodidymelliopsis sp. IMI 364377]
MKPTSQSISANILLPHDFSLYVEWQKIHALDSDIGQVRDALEYRRFIQYREALLSGNQLPLSPDSDPNIASECRHKVHPVDTIRDNLCPICEVSAHLAFMRAIARAWQKAGGPGLRPGTKIMKRSYKTLRDSWHRARLQFLEFLDMLGVLAVYEADWEVKHPLSATTARKTNCASAAMKKAEMETIYPACVSPIMSRAGKTKVSGERKVTFEEEIAFQDDSGPKKTPTNFKRGRPQNRYLRSSVSYVPGTHACSVNSEYIDTSQQTWLPFDVSNLKIYITDDEDAFDEVCVHQHAPIGEHQGIVGLHQLSDQILKFISDDLVQGERAREDLEDSIETADRVIVLVDESGGLLDLFLLDLSEEDEEDEGRDDTKSHGIKEECWTCLRECL